MPVNKIYDPHMTLSFVDKSIPEPVFETPSIDTALSILVPGFSSKGVDNKITECRSRGFITSNFGDDFGSFKKYGQGNIMALAAAKSKARVFFCRLLPDDAKRSYLVFGIEVYKKTDIPVYRRSDTKLNADQTEVVSLGEGPYVLDDKFEKVPLKIKSAASVPDPDKEVTVEGFELRLTDRQLGDDMFDSNGEPSLFNGEPMDIVKGGSTVGTFYPLLTLWYYGRGKGGNDFGIKIERDAARDKIVSDGRRYIFNIYETLSSGVVSPLFAEPFYFSFNPEAMFSPESPISEAISVMYSNNDKSGKPVRVQMIVHDDNYEKLTKALETAKQGNETNTDIDFITCVNKKGNPYHKLVLAETSFNFKHGLMPLKRGTDGSLEVGATLTGGHVVTEDDVAKTKEALLIKFFKCDVDDDIFDEKITDIDLLPDANYPLAVKKTMMNEFTQYRPDIALRMDLGLTKNYREALNKFPSISIAVNDDYAFMCSINGCAGVLTDPDVGTPYPVTYTYDYIKNMAEAFNSGFGAFQMYAGTRRGRVRYMKPYWICKKSKANYIEKFEALALNYIEAIDKYGNCMYGMESSQYATKNSKMASDRNALVIGRAMRICHGILIHYKYDERNVNETLADAQAACVNALRSSNIPGTIKIDVNVYQTTADKREENAHCDIVFEFPDYVKKFVVTIYARRPQAK